ncbi:MAG: glutathione S-transferase family protein [Cyanobacteriota bacterium]|nr:glutathione S-transferase family protein [Cyanobacteriota bacterium]
MAAGLLSWSDLEDLAGGHPARAGTGRQDGPTNAQANLRLFGEPEEAVRVTLYRDHHAWCPYCQKVWLWLEERRIPYRVRKVTMFCYGDKEGWYRRLVPSGMLPALEMDGQLVTESDRILEVLEASFGSLGPGMHDPAVLPLRRLERQLFRAWCQWLCVRHGRAGEVEAQRQFQGWAQAMEQALAARGGPFLLGESLGTADLVFVPYVERMNASLAYYKGYLLRQEHPAIDRWFRALEQRSTYLGTQSDFHTHVHDLPPQMGGCHASGSPDQLQLSTRIDAGPWPILDGTPRLDGTPLNSAGADPETSAAQPNDAATVALARVLRHRSTLLQRNPLGAEAFDQPLRTALSNLIQCTATAPPAGTAAGLRDLRDRISVPRDMPLHAARLLRQALERTALLDPADPGAQGRPLALQHRRDQDPQPFLVHPSDLA